MKDEGRYDVSDLPETQFEPGSNGTVLRNLIGVVSVEDMEVRETDALERATDSLVKSYDAGHRFAASDIQKFHRVWLSEIYAWAGEYRQVNVSKGGFPFRDSGTHPLVDGRFRERATPTAHALCARLAREHCIFARGGACRVSADSSVP